MADMGLGGMGAAAGAGDAIAKVMEQRRQAALDEQNQNNFQQGMAQKDALFRLQVQQHVEAVKMRLQMAQQAQQARADARREHDAILADQQLNGLDPNTPISDETHDKMTGLGVLPERFNRSTPNINTGDGANVAPAPPNALAPTGPSLNATAAPDETTVRQPAPENIGGTYADPAPSFQPVANTMLSQLPPATGGTPPMPPGAQLSVPEPPAAPPEGSPAPNRLGWRRTPTKAEAQEAQMMKIISGLRRTPDGTGEAATDPTADPATRAMLALHKINPNEVFGNVRDPEAGKGDGNFRLNGKDIVGVKQHGRIFYQGKDVTDQVTPYAPPQQPSTVVLGNDLLRLDPGKKTASPVINKATGQPYTKADKPLPATTAANVAGLNVAEVEAVKVLRALHENGLDESNDPIDPRWQKFIATKLKVEGDLSKADIQQRTAFINAALTRQLMGGRPSQYIAELLQQHLPSGEMSGKKLAHALSNVMEQAGEQRDELAQLLGSGVKQPTSGQSYRDYLSELQGAGEVKGGTPRFEIISVK